MAKLRDGRAEEAETAASVLAAAAARLEELNVDQDKGTAALSTALRRQAKVIEHLWSLSAVFPAPATAVQLANHPLDSDERQLIETYADHFPEFASIANLAVGGHAGALSLAVDAIASTPPPPDVSFAAIQSLLARQVGGRSDPVGMSDLASRLDRPRSTVDMYGQRGQLPPARYRVGGRPAWEWRDVERYFAGEALAQPPAVRPRAR